MSRQLLAVCWDMPPMSGPRAVQVSRLLKHLVPLGWNSTVVCFRPRSDRYHQDFELDARLRASSGVTLVPVASLEERLPFRILWRLAPALKQLPDEKWVWIPAAVRAGRRLAAATRFAAIASFAQPWSDHLIGLRLRRSTGLPWVAHFSDPWTDSPYLRGRAWQTKVWRRMEASVVREADALVFVNTQTADAVMRKYGDHYRAKVHVVPHGFDRTELGAVAPMPRDQRLTIVHTGRFYDGMRTPEPLLRALAALGRTRPLTRELRVVLVGTPVASHRALASALHLESIVEFTGRVSFAESARWAAAADVLLVVDAPAADNLFLPSKLVDYLPAQTPILGLTPERGATADLLRALGYDAVAPDDEAAIAAAVESLLDAQQRGRLTASTAHAEVSRQYDIECAARAFAQILEPCA
jgi:glycosyltransferase involved in cell wall biosynthesis